MACSSNLKYTAEDVEALETLVEAMDMLDDYKIEYSEELQTLPELKQVLLMKLEENENENANLGRLALMNDWFLEMADDHLAQIKELNDIYINTLQFIESEATSKIRQQIEKQISNCTEKIVKNNAILSQGYCPILVAGETGAGKSSFLNLLIGEEILPTDKYTSATSTICEIKKSDEKYAVIHKKDNPDSIHITLNGSVEQVRDKLSYYLNSPDRTNDEYDVVEIFWPVSILQGNVYLVDSPGIGESEFMKKKVLQYLPNAAAFIYIINSKIGGGLTKDRMLSMLQNVTHNTDPESLQQFDPRSGMFIFNKWDMVPAANKDKLEENMKVKLEDSWPNLDKDKQIFCLSVTEAERCLRENLGMTDQFLQIMESLTKFMKNGLEMSIRRHYSWLSYFFDRIEMPILYPIAAAKRSKNERENMAKQLEQKILSLREQANMYIGELRKRLHTHVRQIVKRLNEHLKSENTMTRLNKNWKNYGADLNLALPNDIEWKVVDSCIENLIMKAIHAEVEVWEKRNKMFNRAKNDLVCMLKEKFLLFDSELEALEKNMKGTALTKRHVPSKKGKFEQFGLFTTPEKTVLWSTSPLWFPLAILASLIALPIVGSIDLHNWISKNKKLKKYHEDKVEYMQKETEKFLRKMDQSMVTDILVEAQLASIVGFIDKCEDTMHKILVADQANLEALDTSAWSTGEILNTYIPIHAKLRLLCSKVALSKLRHFIHEDKALHVAYEQIKSWGDLIGCGSFGKVYQAEIEINGHLEKCAIKVIDVDISSMHPLELLQEIETLSNFGSIMKASSAESEKGREHVIKLLGANYQYQNNVNEQLLLVMELCTTTLRDAIFRNIENIPVKHHIGEARKKAVMFYLTNAVKLCRGLTYIHDRQIIHRDLKLENILLTAEGQLKICDLGVAKAENKSSGTLKGTLAYLDPEILRGGLSTRYSDIYSLGLILWEMWYGEKVFLEQICEGWDTLRRDIVENDFRPDFEIQPAPFKQLCKLMTDCWTSNPWDRPLASVCKQKLKEMRSKVDRHTLASTAN